jgi:hypothetical protein
VTKDNLSNSSLQANDGAVIHVSPGEVPATDQVIELIAEVSVTNVGLPETSDEMKRKFDGCKDQPDRERLP